MKIKTKYTKTITLTLISSIIVMSCSSTTVIRSEPSDAKIFLNEELVGTTPHSYTDTKVVGSTSRLRLEKEGYEPFYTTFSRNEEVDVGAIIGGFFLLVPFLWTMKYKPVHFYELTPTDDTLQPSVEMEENAANTFLKVDQLKELKQLLDDKAITEEEYETEKKKILE